MTVQELIDELEKLPPDSEVMATNIEYVFPIVSVNESQAGIIMLSGL